MLKNFTPKREEYGMRLDRFLTKYLGLGRKDIQRMIKENNILIDGKPCRQKHFLSEGDMVEVRCILPQSLKIPKKTAAPQILAEESHYLIVEKPAGMVVHPSSPEGMTGTLAQWILEHYPEIASVGENTLRPGMMHRLDKDVSGLMVIARDAIMYDHLKQAFQEHKMKKEYLGLVYGKILKTEGIINFPIARSSKGHRMASRAKTQEHLPGSKDAITEYEVLSYLGKTAGERHGYTLVSLTIKTGRTHQIRAHMHALGHPIVGDPLYRIRSIKQRTDLARLCLHAHKLGFHTLEGRWVEYESPLPSELLQFLASLA